MITELTRCISSTRAGKPVLMMVIKVSRVLAEALSERIYLRQMKQHNPRHIEVLPVQVFSIGTTLVNVHLNWLNQFVFHILVGGALIILLTCMIFLSPFLDVMCQQFLFSHVGTLALFRDTFYFWSLSNPFIRLFIFVFFYSL